MFKKSSSHNEQKRVVTTVLTMPYLPDELLLNCLARISRLYYPTLSLISKRFHSLLASTELYRTRRLLGSTENLSVDFYQVGSDIYIMIGGYNNLEPSSIEKSKDRDFSNFIEFFDPETNIWEHVPSPSAKIHERHIDHCCSFKGNLCLLFRDMAVVYNPKENKWDVVAKELKMLLSCDYDSCMIDNVIYTYSGGSFRMLNWYDCVERSWGDLKGMKKLPELPKAYRGSLRLENCGGKIVLLWEENVRSICSMKEKMLWCAEVALERLNSREIYGKVKWCHVN
ncbi:hypothetical protein Bca101_032217 [Brassica carinata]